MHYVVTGGCGFIGTHLVKHLARTGHSVLVIDDLSTGTHTMLPQGAELLISDILTPGVMSQALQNADGCFHLAAIPSVVRCNQEWFRTSQVNVMGTVAVFDAAKTLQVPVVYASSAAVYGTTEQLPIEETAPLQPISSYGVDKATCEHYGQIAWHTHGVPNIGLRFFNVYGPGQQLGSPYSGVISLFTQAALDKKAITIYGDGEQTRDFIFVEDVVHAMVAAMELPEKTAHVINVCSGNATSINTLAEMIGRYAPPALTINHAPPRAGEVRHSLGGTTRLERMLALPPFTSFSSGLKHTVHEIAGLHTEK